MKARTPYFRTAKEKRMIRDEVMTEFGRDYTVKGKAVRE